MNEQEHREQHGMFHRAVVIVEQIESVKTYCLHFYYFDDNYLHLIAYIAVF